MAPLTEKGISQKQFVRTAEPTSRRGTLPEFDHDAPAR